VRAVVVVIGVDTVFEAVLVEVPFVFVDRAIAIVILAVAAVFGTGMDLGIERFTVRGIGGLVAIVVEVYAVSGTVLVRVRESLVDLTVAVIILPVAAFLCTFALGRKVVGRELGWGCLDTGIFGARSVTNPIVACEPVSSSSTVRRTDDISGPGSPVVVPIPG